jgi:hypothetical protein
MDAKCQKLQNGGFFNKISARRPILTNNIAFMQELPRVPIELARFHGTQKGKKAEGGFINEISTR